MVPELEVRQLHDGVRFVLVARGDIDLATVGGLRAALEDAAGTGGEVWVDLTEVDFMDSTGLNALVVGQLAVNGRMTVICPSGGAARRALEVSGLRDVLNVRSSRDEPSPAESGL